MNPRPTYDDANLILRLYDTRREERLRAARAWFTSKCKGLKTYDELVKLAGPGTDENASFRMVTTYWDMVASFITSGVLNKDLFFQSGRELLLVYVRIGDVLPSIREAYKDPHFLRHLEAVGKDFAAHWQTQNKDAYEAFLKRVK
jgi:hypothetical protein